MIEKIDNQYTIIKELGSGLSGEVYAVVDEKGQKSALKTLKKVQFNVSKEDALAAFKNEFSVLAELNHPGIARILNFGFDTRVQKYYFTTELIEGGNFYEMTRNQPIAVIEELAVGVLRSLNYLHSRGVYHFDIKPQNILVQQSQGKLISKIIDFGLAGFSQPGNKIGTPSYMAPEVILGNTMDGRTDLYSFGVLFYKCLTDKNPFAAKKLLETLENHQKLIPEAPSKINPEIPEYLDTLVLRLLEKNPSERYSDAYQTITQLNQLSGKNFEIETKESRLSYLLEKGQLIGREKEVLIFKKQFEQIFLKNKTSAHQLIIFEGEKGSGKTRLLSELKYYSQLQNVPVFNWDENIEINEPSLLIIDDNSIQPEKINALLQEISQKKFLILWATLKAPLNWQDCIKTKLQNFNENNLKQYLQMVTGLNQPPEIVIHEILKRTNGNPLFVTELLKTMLENNMILDSSGRWAKAAFEDIKLSFDKIKVPDTLYDLLLKKYNELQDNEKEILSILAVLNRQASVHELLSLTQIKHPQSTIISLTQKELIERKKDNQSYFFTKLLLRDVVYNEFSENEKFRIHQLIADSFKNNPNKNFEKLFHEGFVKDEIKAVESLKKLAQIHKDKSEYIKAIDYLEIALTRNPKNLKLESELADLQILARQFKPAIDHLIHIKENLDLDFKKEKNQIEKIFFIFEKIGDLFLKCDSFDKALDYFNEAYTFLEKIPDNKALKMLIENHKARVYLRSGKIEEAEKVFRKNHSIWSLKFSTDEKNKVTNNWLADLLMLQKKYDEALNLIDENLGFYKKINNNFLIARANYLKGESLVQIMHNSKPDEKNNIRTKALNAYSLCLEFSKKVEAFDIMIRTYNGMGSIYYNEKDYQKATETYHRALNLARKIEDWSTSCAISLNLNSIFKIQNKLKDAYAHLIYTLNTLENLENKSAYNWLHLWRCHMELAEIYRQTDKLDSCEKSLISAQEIMNHHSVAKAHAFWVFLEKAKLYYLQNKKELMNENLDKALKLQKEPSEKEELKKFQDRLENKADLSEPKSTQTSTAWMIKPMTNQISNSENIFESILYINKILNTEHDVDQLLKLVLNYALELTSAESGLVLLTDENNDLEIKASVNIQINSDLKKISKTVALKSLQTGEAVISSDALTDERFDESQSVVLNELKSVLCLPLRSRNKVIGVLYLDNKYRVNAFENVDMKVLQTYGDQVGISLENARLIENYKNIQKQLEQKLEKTNEELIETKERLSVETSAYLTRYSYDHIISRAKSMQEVFRVLDKVTETNLSVYLHGASGTGKELIAKALHYNHSLRSDKRFVAINCGAIPPNLIESELFGHKMGSFTGALKDKKGLFEEANGGTVFLDEIGELDLNLQVKLLRVLQEHEVQRIGDTKTIKIDARVICASHKSLEKMAANKIFREDLFYRLCQIKIDLPPLKERKEDIPALVEHFINKFKTENKIDEPIKASNDFIKLLLQYDWPGNVRELENVIQVASALRQGEYLDASSLPPNSGVAAMVQQSDSVISSSPLSNQRTVSIDETNIFNPQITWSEYETLIIAKCYEATGFKKRNTADLLGISPSTLYKKIKEKNLDNKNNDLYQNNFTYTKNKKLKDYVPSIFKAALEQADGHPYAAIRQLGVSQGYFYKVMKGFK